MLNCSSGPSGNNSSGSGELVVMYLFSQFLYHNAFAQGYHEG